MGRPVRYLFLRNGRLAHPDYLFAASLRQVCETLGILSVAGKPAIHAHRFRHTLGTQLAEKGARTQTIMKILGHKSPGMSMTYAHISDPTVLADYQAVLQPGAIIAGPIAETLRAGRLDQDALDWLRTNFYKTELELGRCLRLPPEGPANATSTATAPSSSPRPNTPLDFASASASNGCSSTTPRPAAGNARSTGTSSPPVASSPCLMNWARPLTPTTPVVAPELTMRCAGRDRWRSRAAGWRPWGAPWIVCSTQRVARVRSTPFDCPTVPTSAMRPSNRTCWHRS